MCSGARTSRDRPKIERNKIERNKIRRDKSQRSAPMIVSIMQPAYLPWLGYFDRIARSDVHVVLDHVRMEHNTPTAFTNRNRIRQAQGPAWLTVPIRTKGQQQDLTIDRIEIDATGRFAERHPKSLAAAYGKAPFYGALMPGLAALYAEPATRLLPVLDRFTGFLVRELGLAVPMLSSSKLGVASTKSELVLDICRSLGATRYLSGPFGRDYLDHEAFARAGIAIDWHDYAHPRYRQNRAGFEPYLSVVDLMFNHGPASLAILAGKAEAPPPLPDPRSGEAP